jgi:pyrimidine/purine-5'-nucleotide nucleosidase
MNGKVDTSVSPEGILEVLSQREVKHLLDTGQGGLYHLFRRCCLAVLNCGAETDDAKSVLETYADFSVELVQRERGIKLDLHNAPASAFVDGVMVKGIREHLFAVLRDLVYTDNAVMAPQRRGKSDPAHITDAVFKILRNAGVLNPDLKPNLVVCWGGHSISRVEYDYSKQVGYEMGLRGLDVCTGCGPGAMKGPMKGAAVGHAKQRIEGGRYVGVTEPGIIAAEAPNPIVNELVILPDIEKRLEAFVRLGHGIVVFPGGVGTTEEILYLLGILLSDANKGVSFPLVLTGPASSASYFEQVDSFIGATLGPTAQAHYEIVVDDPARVAQLMRGGADDVFASRRETKDAFYFNWAMQIEPNFQQPFEPTHEAMAGLSLRRDLPPSQLAANLRQVFSGIVAGNVKEEGIKAVEEFGPFELNGDATLMAELDGLLAAFARDGRMKLGGRKYEPVYRVNA